MITGRWELAVQSNYVRCGPSIYKSGWGYDHGMLCTKLKSKVDVESRPRTGEALQTNWEELRLEGVRNKFGAAYRRAHAKMMQWRGATAAAEVIPLSCEQRMEDLTNTTNAERLALGTKEARGKRRRTRSVTWLICTSWSWDEMSTWKDPYTFLS